MRRRTALSRITSALLGGLVLSYVLFLGYVMALGQRWQDEEPTRPAPMGCLSFGRCVWSPAASTETE